MKKLSIYIVAGLFLIAGFSSCQKEYLETKPTDQVASSDVFATTDNAYAAINGIYRSLYIHWLSNQDQGGVSGNMIYMDMMGEDLVNTTRGNGWFISEYQWLSHRNVNSRVPKFNYFFFYSIAGNASMIINNIDNAVGPDADKKLIKGEALAARAWAYFNLVQMFGQRFDAGSDNSSPGVPLVLNNEIEGQPRASVAEVYTQINKDLDDAITNLTGAQARPNTSHINVNVAKGFKARVALTQQNWPLAAQMAHEARQGFSP